MNKTEIVKWKKEAILKLIEIESRDSVYGHQQSIANDERPSIFYTIAEKRMPIDDVIALLRKDFHHNLPPSSFSQEIIEKVLRLLQKSKEKIHSLSSLFVAIESNWGSVDCSFERTKFYDHYHPPRGDKLEINTLSYFEPLYLETEVKENFSYCNLAKLNISGKPAKHWIENNLKDIALDFENLSKQTQEKDWNILKFPETGVLEIVFDSFNNLHNLNGLSDNLFLTIVINDVELKTKLNKGDLHFTYLNEI